MQVSLRYSSMGKIQNPLTESNLQTILIAEPDREPTPPGHALGHAPLNASHKVKGINVF